MGADLDTASRPRAADRWLALLTVLTLLAVAVLLVLVSALLDQDRVITYEDTSAIELGMPLDWVTQDRSSLDVPAPTESLSSDSSASLSAYAIDIPPTLGFASPWENPTTFAAGALVADVVVVFAVLVLAVAFITALVRVVRRI